MLQKFTLRQKVIGAFVAVSVLVGVTGVIAMGSINRLSTFIGSTLTEQIGHSAIVNGLARTLLKSQDATGEYLSLDDPAALADVRREFHDNLTAFDGHLAALAERDLLPVEQDTARAMDELKTVYAAGATEMMQQHGTAVVLMARASAQLQSLTQATPRMLEAAAYAGVSANGQRLLTEQVLAVFDYVAVHNEGARARFQVLDNKVRGLAGFRTFQPAYTEFIDATQLVMTTVAEAKAATVAARAAMERLDGASLKLQELTEQMLAMQADEVAKAQAEAKTIRTQAATIMAAMSVAAVALSLLIGFLVARAIVAPLVQAIAGLDAGSRQVEQSSAQISRAAMQQAEGASEQAASIEQASATMTDMSQRTHQNSEAARTANTVAGKARDAATDGNDKMREMAQAMRDIHASATQIAKVINVIDDIAFQTNILALNAAVEAARAGEAGMGFAVVADEVRNLAQRSAAAAKDTAAMISESIDRATRGVSIMESAGGALEQITHHAVEMSGLVERIAMASAEQADGIGQMTQAMQQMEQVTQQAATSAERSASSGEALNTQVTALRDLVSTMDTLVWGASTARAAHDATHDDGGGRVLSPLRGDRPEVDNLF
ncbi:MAG: methyl-accepting chemotaxis protein [Nitrospirae bacterium]|nr:methyl-accepting chemotaxis protein [Nitrospirota bacterium]